MKRFWLALILCAMALALVACNPSTEESSEPEMKESLSESLSGRVEESAEESESEETDDLVPTDASAFIMDGTTLVGLTDYGKTLTQIVVPEGVTEIRSGVFSYNFTVETIILPDGVTKIADGAFSGCSKLETLVIGEGVKTLGARMFYCCRELSYLKLPDSLEELYGQEIFWECQNITTVHMSSSIRRLDGPEILVLADRSWEIHFKDIDALYNWMTAERTEIHLTGVYVAGSPLTELTVPDDMEKIGDYALHGCPTLERVVIPTSVKWIGDYAFNSCKELDSITLPDTVEYIGRAAFLDTKYANDESNWEYEDFFHSLYIGKHLMTISPQYEGSYEVLPGTVTVAGSVAFGSNTLTSVSIPGTVRSIGEAAFKNCAALESVRWERGMKDAIIGERAFESCPALTYIKLPDMVTHIGRYAFAHSALEQIVFSKSLKVIEEEAFYCCESLRVADLPEGLLTVKACAFFECPLERVVVPLSVQQMEDGVYTVVGAMYCRAESIPEGWEPGFFEYGEIVWGYDGE